MAEAPVTHTNPLDFPRYVRSLRPSLPESLPNFVDDELEKVSKSLMELEEASNNFAEARVEEERIVRVTDDEALAARIVTVAAEFEAANATTNARVTTEEIARANAVEAVASRVTNVEADFASANADTNARVTVEELARATADEAIASRIETVATEFRNSDAIAAAFATTEVYTRSTADEALATRIDTVEADYITADGVVSASVVAEATARASADSALAATITTLTATVGTNTAAITAEATARASADTAIAGTVTTLNTTVGGHTSTLTTYGTSISGLQAKYGVKLDVNGYVSGFEQNNGGGTSDFIIRADKFKVIMPGFTGGTPFTVDSGGVHIDGSLTVNGTITGNKLVIGGVDTSQLAVNSVTVPVSSSGSTVVISGTGGTVQNVTLNSVTTNFSAATGATCVIFINCRFTLTSTGVGCPVTVHLKEDGVVLRGYAFMVPNSGTASEDFRTIFAVSVPAAGAHTYEVTAALSGGGYSGTYSGVGTADIFYQEAKR